MLKATVGFFDKMMREYTPDPFILALLLTLILLSMGVFLTPASPKDMIIYWGNGFWGLAQFTLQMIMVLVGGYIIAVAPPIKRVLVKIASNVSSPSQAVFVVSIVALIASYINWGLGLVVGGIMCREIIKVLPQANYRLLVASGYSGFIVWHGGLSASIPLILATEGNFTQELVGGVIPISYTIFSPLNLVAILGMFVLLPITNWFLGRILPNTDPVKLQAEPETKAPISVSKMYPAERLENSRILPFVMALMGGLYIVFEIMDGTFTLNLNDVNFIFLFAAILFHRTPRSLIDAVSEAAQRVGPILLQFPFYAGIMGMMGASMLAELFSDVFVEAASADTFPLLTFYSAAALNLFIPSGGGQWAIQGPIILEAANKIGADIPKVAMAVAWGDAWTNLLQPFWALPLLAIAGLKLREVMGYCVCLLLVSGIFLSLVFLFL